MNKSENEENDIIEIIKIDLATYKPEIEKRNHLEVDYSVYRQYIMEVLNYAMNVTRENSKEGSDITVYQLFQLFM
jgi:hypothetical protein